MKTKRRAYPRVDVNITIKQLGNAVNISEGGLCVIVDIPLTIGHKIDLDLFLPDSSDDSKQETSNIAILEGEVVWVKNSELLDKYEVGIKFTDTHPHSKEKVKSFIERHT